MKISKIEIIYQDNDIIVLNKPSGVSVTKDRAGDEQLIDILPQQIGKELTEELLLVHRLDKQTSGVLLLARNKQAQTTFSRYFEEKLVKKTYLAIVTGITTEKEGTIYAPIGVFRKNQSLMCIDRKDGKEAITNWRILADFGNAALVAVNPVTGRTHQIRVHLPSIGLPLAIDPMYGSTKPLMLSEFKLDYRLGFGQDEKPLIERLTLHAYQLELPNCETNRPKCFIAPLDKKFAATIKMLTKYNSNGPAAFINPDDFTKIISIQKLD